MINKKHKVIIKRDGNLNDMMTICNSLVKSLSMVVKLKDNAAILNYEKEEIYLTLEKKDIILYFNQIKILQQIGILKKIANI